MLRISLLFVLALFLTHCGTVSPDIIHRQNASVGSDGLQDSGVKGVLIDPVTKTRYFSITAEDRDDYNRKIAAWGEDRALDDAPISKDFGLRPYHQGYAMTARAWVDWGLMIDLSGGAASK